jgi:hypothetical protein
MRFLLAVLGGSVLFAARYWNELDAVPWPIQLGFMSLVALAVGFAVGRRGWLAAFAAFVVGHALWVAVELRPSRPWAASDVPTAAGAMILGALGAWVGRLRPIYAHRSSR